MRPRRLEVSGFTAFREPVTVDFRGADLFALTGPTGSGKSSLIDAIVFALYGSVPRIGQREVAPIVSLGKLEARVRFDFSLDGADYSVVRVVRRTGSGASTAEARLERKDEVLAGTADEVTETIGRMLGLGFDHFTKSVVLPQGRFAAFLHDRPADRQKLLRELLDLGVYEHMREVAKQRRTAAETRVQVLQTQLEELAFATPEAEEQAGERQARLLALREEVEEAEPKLQALRDQIEVATQAGARALASIEQLAAVQVPEGIAELAERLSEARRSAAQTADEATAAGERLDKVEAACRLLPTEAEIEKVIGLHRALVDEHRTLESVSAGLDAVAREVAVSAETLAAAGVKVEAARRDLDAANRDHAAHTLAATLVEGEECPVCRQTVQNLPPGGPPPAVAGAQRAVEAAEESEAAARRGHTVAAQRLATEEARTEDLTKRIEGFRSDLGDAPSLDEALRTREDVAAAQSDLKEARSSVDRIAKAVANARKEVDTAEADTKVARRRFDETRDLVASLEPPVPERTDLAADWSELADWAVSKAARLSDELATAQQVIEDLQSERAEMEETLIGRIDREGLVVDGPIRDAVLTACAAANHDLARLRDAAQRAAEHRTAIAESSEEANVSKSLGRHLSATGFEAWLMEEALATLVDGANVLLDDLAEGAYSLDVVKRDFRVIDHHNADEPRLVKTLSGGETFLVSLALALSLAEQLASMSVHGGSRLESVFLDEGFGTLDMETLDTVAHVIQELGARGRTVGIVTHVRELAEQVPIRFEVRKRAGTATVERVEL